jgi:hypothetical protein
MSTIKYECTYQAIEAGDFEQLKAMLADGYPLNHRIGGNAGSGGNVEILEFLHNYEGGSRLDYSTLLKAVANDHFAAVDWCLKNNFEWPEKTLSYCIEHSGSLETVKYIISKGCPIEIEAAAIAAKFGRLPVLKWLHRTHNLPLSGEREVSRTDYADFFYKNRFVFNSASIATIKGNIKCLKYAYENGCQVFEPTTTVRVIYELEETGSKWEQNQIFKCLEFALDHGCPVDPETTFDAIYYNDLRLLKFLYSKGQLKLDEDEMLYAYEIENPKVIEFLEFVKVDTKNKMKLLTSSVENNISNNIINFVVDKF